METRPAGRRDLSGSRGAPVASLTLDARPGGEDWSGSLGAPGPVQRALAVACTFALRLGTGEGTCGRPWRCRSPPAHLRTPAVADALRRPCGKGKPVLSPTCRGAGASTPSHTLLLSALKLQRHCEPRRWRPPRPPARSCPGAGCGRERP